MVLVTVNLPATTTGAGPAGRKPPSGATVEFESRVYPGKAVDHFSKTRLLLPGSLAISRRTGQPAQFSHWPPPGVQVLGTTIIDQQRRVPTPPAVSSAIRRCQVPFTSAPNLPL